MHGASSSPSPPCVLPRCWGRGKREPRGKNSTPARSPRPPLRCFRHTAGTYHHHQSNEGEATWRACRCNYHVPTTTTTTTARHLAWPVCVCVCVPLQPPPNLFQLTIAPAGVGRGNEGTRFVRSVLANFYVGHVQPLIFLLLCVCARACVSCCLRRRRARLCARIATHPGRRRLQPTSREWGLENDDEGFRRGSRRLLHKNGRVTSRLLALSSPRTVVPGSVPVS